MSYRTYLTTLALLTVSTLSSQPQQGHVVTGEALFSDLETKNRHIINQSYQQVTLVNKAHD